MSDSAQRFASEFKAAHFHHRETLIEGIERGDVTLQSFTEDSSQKASSYLRIYEFRLEGLDRRLGNTNHVSELKSDVRALCAGLAKEPDDRVDLWIFSKDPYYTYSVFVGHETRSVFGCFRGVDDRLIDAETRRTLWGENEGEQVEDPKPDNAPS